VYLLVSFLSSPGVLLGCRQGWEGVCLIALVCLFFLFTCLFQDKNKLADKANLGFPVSDNIGRLQVENLASHFS
jgi:hypothetical protein